MLTPEKVFSDIQECRELAFQQQFKLEKEISDRKKRILDIDIKIAFGAYFKQRGSKK